MNQRATLSFLAGVGVGWFMGGSRISLHIFYLSIIAGIGVALFVR